MDGGGGGKQQPEHAKSSRHESSRKKFQEPPKFYNKTYLRRYNHGGEVRSNSPSALPPASTILQGIASRKKSREGTTVTGDRTSVARNFSSLQAYRERKASAVPRSSIQKVSKDSSDPATITISPTVLKLADGVKQEATSNVAAGTSSGHGASVHQTRPKSAYRPENSVNPYNRVPANSDGAKVKNSGYGADQQDVYRYSFMQAMSSVKSSYFKNHSDATPESFYKYDENSVSTNIVTPTTVELVRTDTFKKIKNKVEEAIKRHKIFLIRGELPKLKEALEERGWVQKYESSRTRSLPYTSTTTLDAKSLGDVRLPDGSPNERALTFALLRNAQPDFIWDCRNDFIEWDRGIANNVLLNRFHKPSIYTSKLGMAHVLQEAHWIHETNVADVLFPRSYNPSREMPAFVQDFRRCSAIAVLRTFVKRMDREDPRSLINELEKHPENSDGHQKTFSLDWIEAALKCCDDYVIELENDDIDLETWDEMSEEQWRAFFEDCDRFLYKSDGMDALPKSDSSRLQACHTAAVTVLEKLKNVDSQFDLSGEKNIWIVKPSNLCCGSGIFMTHDLRTILRKVESKPRDYYIVQKYIERPLLVHGTKFDIRQWFLVTSTYPMVIWSFREALLRLSSKPYSCSTYHEAIHICNTAVQEKYDWDRKRRRSRHQGGSSTTTAGSSSMSASTTATDDSEISIRDQGWDCEKLNDYFKSQGYEGEPYYEKIYPKMTQAIVLTMLASQDFMDRRRCSFELYGADFMVMEDMSVWLIEINTNPRMHPPSSRITQRLYGSVLDSLVKVVMDLPMNSNADTGGFELVYKQDVPETQPYLGPCLFAFGKSMTLQEPPPPRKQHQNPSDKSDGLHHCTSFGPWSKQQYRAWTAPPLIERLREPKVVDFIASLQNKTESSHKSGGNDVREAADENTIPESPAVTTTTSN